MMKRIFFLLFLLSIHRYPADARPLDKQERIGSMLKEAAEQFNQGLYTEAERTYRDILSIDKKNAEAYSNLGLVYAKQKRLDKALESSQKALSLKPDEPEYCANLGFVHIVREDPEKAEQVLRKAVEKDNELFKGFWWLGEVSKRQEKYDLALGYAQRASRIDPERYEPYKVAAEVYAARQEYENAVVSYLRAQSKESRRFDLYYDCAEAALKQGDKRRAKQQFKKALYLREHDYELRMRLADIYHEDGEYGDAFREFAYVAEKGADHLKGEALYGAGLSLFKNEDFADAAEYASRAVEVSPDSKKYRTLLSDTYEKQGKFKEAAAVMASVQAGNSNEYQTLGYKHEKAGEFEKAAGYYEKGIASDPGKGIFYLKLGLMRTKIEDAKEEPENRDYSQAKQAYEKAIANDLHDAPEMPKIAYNLGRLYEGHPEGMEQPHSQALACYWKAIKGAPLMIKAYFAVAGAYVRTRPWNNGKHVAVWSAVVAVLFGCYIIRRHRIKKKLAEQTSGKGEKG